MSRLLIASVLAISICTGCGSIRPSDEMARYMVRSAGVNKVAEDGTYILTPGVNMPPVFSADLKAGDPIGFRFVDTTNGKQLYAVAGADDSYLLDRAQRYTWTRARGTATVNGVPNTSAIEEQLRITERARDDAKRQLDAAQKNLDAAERRLNEVRARAGTPAK